MNYKKISVFLFFLLSVSIVTYAAGRAQPKLPVCVVTVVNGDKKQLKLDTEIADCPTSRAYGLMHRETLDENSAMIFIFKVDEYLNFWMKNVTLPLSIAFIDKTGTITDIHRMRPLDASVSYLSSVPVRYALEVNQGWFNKNKVKVGHKVILDGCISQ